MAGSRKLSGEIDLYILHIDESGDTTSTRTLGTYGSDVAYSAVELPDSGLAIAGKTFQSGTNDFWLIKLGGDLISRVDENPTSAKPADFAITAYPNPFNSAVSIAAPYGAEIEIFDLNGRRVAQLSYGGTVGANLVFAHSTGDHKDRPYECVWQPSESLPSGVYLVRARFDDCETKKRIVYLK